MNVNAFLQKDYENEPPSGPKKTNPNKANFFKGQNELRAYPNNRATPIPALLKVFDGSINFDIITSR
ncbi:MAG: hypothetical protein ABIL62_00430 [Planctomycetota bacterium]